MYRTLKIGLSMRVVNAAGYAERRDAISQEWMQLLESWGATPILLPNTFSDIGTLLEMVDLVILTGGNDVCVDPKGVQISACNDPAEERDLQEYRIIDYCIARIIPLIGVCRGMQLINYRFGGEVEAVDKTRHVASKHNVRFKKSRFCPVVPGTCSVNSFHAYGITEKTMGSDLEVLAKSDDHVIEAFFHNQYPILGVMWHPERNEFFSKMDKFLVMKMIKKARRELN
jgi:gamma-glutamyl-gamma-aminobutyrate hydrolase PuuD